MKNKRMLSQTDLEPTKTEQQAIIDDLIAKNVERAAQGLPQRSVAQYAELAFVRHRARAYQDLLDPYLEATLDQARARKGHGLSPLDYRTATADAQEQLRAATGIVAPVGKMKPETFNLIGHKPMKSTSGQSAAMVGNDDAF
jgi:hypothetical protein